ncbi:hypothetical protein LINPERHAP2_LOCUS26602 [Linum perenne]
MASVGGSGASIRSSRREG